MITTEAGNVIIDTSMPFNAALHKRLLTAEHQGPVTKDYKYLRPGIEQAPWNAKCMEVIDPFGNRIRFSEDVEFGKSDSTMLTEILLAFMLRPGFHN